MSDKRVPLYDRLPEIYRIRDAEETGPKPLAAYLSIIEEVWSEVHANIEGLYHDFFIETCDDWVIPYLADLVGSSHLSGQAATLRRDVADTIKLRRRKGTLSAIEELTSNLTQWHTHAVELRKNVVWAQHLNHQRPDAGGNPPLAQEDVDRFTVPRGGTATVRDPATMALIGSPFDPYAHFADVRTPVEGALRYNIPNLAIFLWRLEAYKVRAARPVERGSVEVSEAGAAAFVARFDVDPLGRPLRLFNRAGRNRDSLGNLAAIDRSPGPMPRARLTTGSPAGNPEAYIRIDTYDPTGAPVIDEEDGNLRGDVGLHLHVPESEFQPFDASAWTFRGANLCAWQDGLGQPLKALEVAIDPDHGRLAIGVDSAVQRDALISHLRISYTYGAVGEVGAHPLSRPPNPEDADVRRVPGSHNSVAEALADLATATGQRVVEITDSLVHELDLAAVSGTVDEDGGPNLALTHSLTIRAADNERPILRLTKPLRFRPSVAENASQTVKLEGLFVTRDVALPSTVPLIARVAVHALELDGTTLDPGGYENLDGSPADSSLALRLHESYGFTDPDEEIAFDQTPEIRIRRSITGSLRLERSYKIDIRESIVDGGSGVSVNHSDAKFALAGAVDPEDSSWSAETHVQGVTFFGRVRAHRLSGSGGIFVHALEVHDNQWGCIKFSTFSGNNNRLPQNHACVTRDRNVHLRFVSERFLNPAYGQLARTTDFRIRERGPDDDAMGAFGFLLQSHSYRNLTIRFREFMPVGVRHLLVPVT